MKKSLHKHSLFNFHDLLCQNIPSTSCVIRSLFKKYKLGFLRTYKTSSQKQLSSQHAISLSFLSGNFEQRELRGFRHFVNSVRSRYLRKRQFTYKMAKSSAHMPISLKLLLMYLSSVQFKVIVKHSFFQKFDNKWLHV